MKVKPASKAPDLPRHFRHRLRQLTSIAPAAEPGLPIDVGIWVGRDDSLVYKILMVGPMSSDEEPNITRTILISTSTPPSKSPCPTSGAGS